MWATHTEILDDHASSLYYFIKITVSRFVVIEDPTDMPSPSQLTSTRHTPSSSYPTQFRSPIPLFSDTVHSLITKQSDVKFSVTNKTEY